MSPGLAAHKLGAYLKKNNMSLACAESCTGGLAAAALTKEAGASGYFLGCVVAYANSAKSRVLGIPARDIEAHGAVSKDTAMAMAQAARDNFGSDCSFSVTGIAGPGGGLPDKPVGTVWFGFSVNNAVYAKTHVFKGNRARIRRDAVTWALNTMLNLLCQSNELDNTL
jgi:nicotinamide-nucleotide amidase